jgi:hypothetical protein
MLQLFVDQFDGLDFVGQAEERGRVVDLLALMQAEDVEGRGV